MGKSQTPGLEKPVISVCEPSWVTMWVLRYLASSKQTVSGFSWTQLWVSSSHTCRKLKINSSKTKKHRRISQTFKGHDLCIFPASGFGFSYGVAATTAAHPTNISVTDSALGFLLWEPNPWTDGFYFNTVHQKTHFLWLWFTPDPVSGSQVSKYTN